MRFTLILFLSNLLYCQEFFYRLELDTTNSKGGNQYEYVISSLDPNELSKAIELDAIIRFPNSFWYNSKVNEYQYWNSWNRNFTGEYCIKTGYIISFRLMKVIISEPVGDQTEKSNKDPGGKESDDKQGPENPKF